MTFIDITCMSDRSEEVIIETFPRRNDTPFFTTRSCRLNCNTSTDNDISLLFLCSKNNYFFAGFLFLFSSLSSSYSSFN